MSMFRTASLFVICVQGILENSSRHFKKLKPLMQDNQTKVDAIITDL